MRKAQGPQCRSRIQQSDAQLLQDLRECAERGDPVRAVVDSSLCVYGVEALRVIDASVFPTVISGNTDAPTIMVEEKARRSSLRKRATDP